MDKTVVEFNMSYGSVYNIVHGDLGYRKVCSRWVPKQLSDDHKHARQTICQEHLDCHAHEGDAFLHQIVTGDESWVYDNEPESKRKHAVEAPVISGQQKIQDTGFCWESHADHLLGCQWPYFGARLEKGSNCTIARYSDMLVNELKPAIRLKCWGFLSKRVLLLHENTRPHMAAHKVDTL